MGRIRSVAAARELDGAPAVEIEVNGTEVFPVRDALYTLRIGTYTARLSRYGTGHDLKQLVFTVPRTALSRMAASEPVVLSLGASGGGPRWQLGRLSRRVLLPR